RWESRSVPFFIQKPLLNSRGFFVHQTFFCAVLWLHIPISLLPDIRLTAAATMPANRNLLSPPLHDSVCGSVSDGLDL
ncbi:hypothetical protein, partial [Sphingobacterium faecium]|uniref:hypothetical protein n=1 Tax=Sphingobacterium faecium TaxID=34087 RepID=UPI00320A49E6